MFAAALVVFREVLEASLVISIIMAATRGVPTRGKWVSFGILGGLAGAGIVAAMAGFISEAFDGTGQEITNAAILFLATGLIGWHVVWMNSHGREMARDMRNLGTSVAEGNKHLSILAIVVGLAVLREGAEVVLILQGLWTTESPAAMLGGGGIGLITGLLAGFALYAGLISLSIGRVFSFTNFILTLIAAGMAARGANFLVQADLLPSLGSSLWDTSSLLSEEGVLGKFMAALVGYIARPSGIELLFYVLTIALVTTLTLTTNRNKNIAIKTTLAAATILFGALTFSPLSAHADEVLSPRVTQGEVELEHQGFVSHDRATDESNEQAFTMTLGYTPFTWWKTELEGEFEREAGSDHTLRYETFNWENTFPLAEQGEYWFDPALFYEMGFGRGDEPNEIKFGFLGEGTFGSINETFNLLAHKDYGLESTPTGFSYSSQTKYRLSQWFEPGFEIYGDTQGHEKFAKQKLAIGPAIFGKIYTLDAQAIKYQVGYMFGATPATPDRALRWKIEYEFYF